MNFPDVTSVFDLLDSWRHRPSYRLEPRADVFFGLFLPEVLNHHLATSGIEIDPRIIPEFPLGQKGTHRSNKADFFAVSKDLRHAFLIELKTDSNSLRDKQEEYLNEAVERGMRRILCGLRSIAKATRGKARKKYFHLLSSVADLGLVTLPDELEHKIYCSTHGVVNCIDRIEILPALPEPKLKVIHVLPALPESESGSKKPIKSADCIVFQCFADIVEQRGELGARFAASLRAWSRCEAGSKCSASPSSQQTGQP